MFKSYDDTLCLKQIENEHRARRALVTVTTLMALVLVGGAPFHANILR